MGLLTKKIPTGIQSVDMIVKGGFPSGSFTLLTGEVGAGSAEFAFTSAIMISLLKSGIITLPGGNEDVIIPDSVCYISLTRSKEDIMREISLSFPEDYYSAIKDNLIFKDFSKDYFKLSPFPFDEWPTETFESLRGLGRDKDLLESLVDYLNENASGSLVIIDSLTDLVRMYSDRIKWQDLVSFLKGLQRASTTWDGLIYLLLTADIFESSKQEEIADCADGVLVFEWGELGTAQRQRTMYVKKFRGLLLQLESENIAKFETIISPSSGFEVSNVKMIMGRR